MNHTLLKSFLLGSIVCMFSCQQQPGPQPTTPTPVTPTTPTSIMSAGEAALKGKWFQKKTSISGSVQYYNSPNYYIRFDSTLIIDNTGTQTRTGYGWYNSNTSIGGYTTWHTNTTGDTLKFQSPSPGTMNEIYYRIDYVSSDSLVIKQYGTGCSCNFIYYFHK